MTDIDAIEARANAVLALEGADDEFHHESAFAGIGMGLAERTYYATVNPQAVVALVAEVRRLESLVHAKQSWIDGAKVDLDAMDEQTLTLTASVAAHSTALEKEQRKVAFLSRELHTKEHERDDARAAIARVRAVCDDQSRDTPYLVAGTLARVRRALDGDA